MSKSPKPTRQSKRFQTNRYSEKLVPILLALLSLGLLAVMVLLAAALLGWV
jgi:hypothetical protein